LTVTTTTPTITIDNTLTGSNLGSGTGIFSSKSGASLQFNSVTSGSGTSLSFASNTITIAGPPTQQWFFETSTNVGIGGTTTISTTQPFIAYGSTNTSTVGPNNIISGFPGLIWGSGIGANQSGGLFQVATTGYYRISITLAGSFAASQSNNISFWQTNLTAASAVLKFSQTWIFNNSIVQTTAGQVIHLDSTLWYGLTSFFTVGAYQPYTYAPIDQDPNSMVIEFIRAG
jgi:hypothetical protein